MVGLAADRDAALLVDGIDRQLEGVAVVARRIGEAARELERCAEGDGLGRGRDPEPDEGQHQDNDDELDGSHPTFPLSARPGRAREA